MFIDTHGHVPIMLSSGFDSALTADDIKRAARVIEEAKAEQVNSIINVGTSRVESTNSVLLAKTYNEIFATVGIHPNDCTASWHDDFIALQQLAKHKHQNKIVGIGECGIDKHYPGYNLSRQVDAFRAQIELALECDLALVVHSRDAYDETLTILDGYNKDINRAVIHCFSYDQTFADHVTAKGYFLGIGGTITYPKNIVLQAIVQKMDIKHMVLETDAPFLPLQQYRGEKNHPKRIAAIAAFIANLRTENIEYIAEHTTRNARILFALDEYVAN